MSLHDRLRKRKQTHECGYVSFTEQDLKDSKSKNQLNAEAYDLLDAAMTTSSNISEVDKHAGVVDVDDIYPCTQAECDEMDSLLDKAEATVKDKSDNAFQERLSELRGIVAWSREKHWTFKWGLIGGCVLSVFGMMYLRSNAKGDLEQEKTVTENVRNWAKQDTTMVFESCPEAYQLPVYSSANESKASRLQSLKHEYSLAVKSVATYHEKIDTCTSKERKKSYEASLKEQEKRQKELRAEWDEVNAMGFKEYQKMVLKDREAIVDEASSSATWTWILLAYVILLIPAYIYSSHQYGYNITRHRAEARVLGNIQKISFAVASFFLGSGLAMSLLPDYEERVTYYDGHEETRTTMNPSNVAILALKGIMIFIGLVIFCIVSVLIMTYVTVMAAKRDHDWSKVASATRNVVGKAASAASGMAKNAVGKIKETNETE